MKSALTADTEIPLTFIIPAYGRQLLLDRALRSLCSQDVVPQCVVVVDDNSEPALRLPVSLKLPRVELVRQSSNCGPAAARNAGLALAPTKWVSFLDCDDLLIANTLGLRWRQMIDRQHQSSDEKVITGCSWIDVTPEMQPLQVRHPRPGNSPADFASGCWFSPGSCIIMNAHAALEAVGFQDEKLRRLEDIDWFLALSLKGFRFESSETVGALIERKRVQNPKSILDAAKVIQEKWKDLLPGSLRRRLDSYLQLESAAAHYFAGDRFAAIGHYARSLMLQPRLSLQLSPGWDIRSAGQFAHP